VRPTQPLHSPQQQQQQRCAAEERTRHPRCRLRQAIGGLGLRRLSGLPLACAAPQSRGSGSHTGTAHRTTQHWFPHPQRRAASCVHADRTGWLRDLSGRRRSCPSACVCRGLPAAALRAAPTRTFAGLGCLRAASTAPAQRTARDRPLRRRAATAAARATLRGLRGCQTCRHFCMLGTRVPLWCRGRRGGGCCCVIKRCPTAAPTACRH